MPPNQNSRCRSTLFAMMLGRSSLKYLFVLVVPINGLLLAQTTASKHKPGVQQQPFGTREGRPINLYTLTNSHGLEVHAMNYGDIILSLRVPDRQGQSADIVVGAH